MANPTIHGKRPAFSASLALESVAGDLLAIKHQDSLKWHDIGAVLGVSEDQAAKYADASAAMNIVTFGRGKREWNGRFTGSFDRLCVESRPRAFCDSRALSAVINASLVIAEAKANGDQIFPHEVKLARPILEQAREAIDDLLRMDELT